MQKYLNYSILQSRSTNGETINLGVVFFCEETKEKAFFHTTNLSRVNAFDKEINEDILKSVFQGVEESVDAYFTSCEAYHEFTKYYVNYFRFTIFRKIRIDDFMESCERIFKWACPFG